MSNKLLTRDEFRESVFARDKYKCVACDAPAKDAHHLIDRRLFNDGGYYLSNGASVCEQHHIEAEQTILSVESLREMAGIKDVSLPSHLYRDQIYTKWADPILPNGQRLRGELFNDPSVQKILGQGKVLHLYTKYVKYPRTYHLQHSPGITEDDRVMEDYSGFEGKEVVATGKQDGENTTMYNDYIHARSLEYSSHPSRNLIKSFHARIKHDIPDGFRLCLENLFAKHSIHYQNLANHFQLFSVWNEQNYCLSWNETVEWAELLGLTMVPVLYKGIWDQKVIEKLYQANYDGDECEGFVVRIADSFHYKDFRKVVGKYVRANHVIHNSSQWRRGIITENKVKK